jgi:hypothetical protein
MKWRKAYIFLPAAAAGASKNAFFPVKNLKYTVISS